MGLLKRSQNSWWDGGGVSCVMQRKSDAHQQRHFSKRLHWQNTSIRWTSPVSMMGTQLSWRPLLFLPTLQYLNELISAETHYTDICCFSHACGLISVSRTMKRGLWTHLLLAVFSCRFWVSSVYQQLCFFFFFKDLSWNLQCKWTLWNISKNFVPGRFERRKKNLPVSAVIHQNSQMNLWTAPVWDPKTLRKGNPLHLHITGVFVARCVYKGLDGDDKMLWWIITRILACQTSCFLLVHSVDAISPASVDSGSFFATDFRCFLNIQQKLQRLFQRAFESQEPKTAIETKCSSCQPANQHTQLWSISSSLLSILWLDLCCLDTVHTAVRLGHSQAREESGVNGTWKTLFPKMYLFLNYLKWKEGFFALLMMRLEGVSNPVFYSTYGKVGNLVKHVLAEVMLK